MSREIPAGEPDESRLDADLAAILEAKDDTELRKAIVAAHQESRRRVRGWGWGTLRAIGVIAVALLVAIIVGQVQNNDRADENKARAGEIQSNLEAQARERARNAIASCMKDDRDNSTFSLFLRDIFPAKGLNETQLKQRAEFFAKAARRYPYHPAKPDPGELGREEFCRAQVKATVKTPSDR